jgi:hypothetical protein
MEETTPTGTDRPASDRPEPEAIAIPAPSAVEPEAGSAPGGALVPIEPAQERISLWKRIALRRSVRRAHQLADSAQAGSTQVRLDAFALRLDETPKQLRKMESALSQRFDQLEERLSLFWEIEEQLGQLGEIHDKLGEVHERQADLGARVAGLRTGLLVVALLSAAAAGAALAGFLF